MTNLLNKLFNFFKKKKKAEVGPLKVETFESAVEAVKKQTVEVKTEVWQVKAIPKGDAEPVPNFTSVVNKTERDIDRIREIERAVTQARMDAIRKDQERPRRAVTPTSSRADDTLLMTSTYVGTYSQESSSRSSNEGHSPSHSGHDCSPSDSGSSSGGCD